MSVQIQETDAYLGYIKPIKAGNSYQFSIVVTINSIYPSCTVSIDKNSMNEVISWITIDYSIQTLLKGNYKTFILTIIVPANASDRNYLLPLYFIVKDSQNNDHSFWGSTQTIVVDKSVPQTPTLSISTTNNSVYAYSWYSYDTRSADYTTVNQSSGIGGIKTYTIVLKNPDGSVHLSKLFNATSASSYNFTSLSSSTNYKVSLTATDLAGNFKSTSDLAATTTPDKPTGLAFSNTTYTTSTLTWTAVNGATGYDVYKYENPTNTKLNSTPVTGTSYVINNLIPNTSYTFNVIALNSGGASPRSNNASIVTVALPPITGTSPVCSGGSTFTVQNLLAGWSVTNWTYSSNLQAVYGGSNFIVLKSIQNGTGNVNATITSSSDTLDINRGVWAGIPLTPYNIFCLPSSNCDACPDEYVEMRADDHNNMAFTTYNWIVAGGTIVDGQGSWEISVLTGSQPGNHFDKWVRAENTCGVSSYYGEYGYIGECGGGEFMVIPNPADSYVDIAVDRETIQARESTLDGESNLRIFDKMGIMNFTTQVQEFPYWINTGNLAEGIYLIQIVNNGKSYSLTLLIEH